jgi:hypothetical protein
VLGAWCNNTVSVRWSPSKSSEVERQIDSLVVVCISVCVVDESISLLYQFVYLYVIDDELCEPV